MMIDLEMVLLGISIIRLPFLIFGGVFTPEIFRIALVLLAPLLIGLIAGMLLFSRIPSKWIRRFVQALLAVSAVLLIVQSA